MPGTLTVPNVIGNQPGGNVLASLFDDNYTAITTYVNARQALSGSFAARPTPSASNAGLIYVATDVADGTSYLSTGTVWVQMGSPVTLTPPSPTGAINDIQVLQGSRAGHYSTTSASFVDVDATNLKATITVPVGSAWLLAFAYYSVLGTAITDGQPHVQILAAGTAFGPYNWLDNSTLNPVGPFWISGALPSPPSGAQTVALQFSGDGTNAMTLSNGSNEGSIAAGVYNIVPKLFVLVTS